MTFVLVVVVLVVIVGHGRSGGRSSKSSASWTFMWSWLKEAKEALQLLKVCGRQTRSLLLHDMEASRASRTYPVVVVICRGTLG